MDGSGQTGAVFLFVNLRMDAAFAAGCTTERFSESKESSPSSNE